MRLLDFPDASSELEDPELYALTGSAMTLPVVGALMWFVAVRILVVPR